MVTICKEPYRTNVPRVTSPGGEELRACFGVDHENDRIQFGFDFASLSNSGVASKYKCIELLGRLVR